MCVIAEPANAPDLDNDTLVEESKWKIENGKLKIKGRFAPIYIVLWKILSKRKVLISQSEL